MLSNKKIVDTHNNLKISTASIPSEKCHIQKTSCDILERGQLQRQK